MKTKKILIAAGIAVTAVVIYRLVKKKKTRVKRRYVVAEEGYETAEDILFPKRHFLRFS